MTICRRLWADYFDGQQIQYAFFSAANAAAIQEARRAAESRPENEVSDEEPSHTSIGSEGELADESSSDGDDDSGNGSDSESEGGLVLQTDEANQDPRTRVLSVVELENLFATVAPNLSSKPIVFAQHICIKLVQISRMQVANRRPSLLWDSLDTPTLVNPVQSMLCLVRRKLVCPPHPERRSISRRYISHLR